MASARPYAHQNLSEDQYVFIRGFRVTHTRQVLPGFKDSARQIRDSSKPGRQTIPTLTSPTVKLPVQLPLTFV